MHMSTEGTKGNYNLPLVLKRRWVSIVQTGWALVDKTQIRWVLMAAWMEGPILGIKILSVRAGPEGHSCAHSFQQEAEWSHGDTARWGLNRRWKKWRWVWSGNGVAGNTLKPGLFLTSIPLSSNKQPSKGPLPPAATHQAHLHHLLIQPGLCQKRPQTIRFGYPHFSLGHLSIMDASRAIFKKAFWNDQWYDINKTFLPAWAFTECSHYRTSDGVCRMPDCLEYFLFMYTAGFPIWYSA